MANGPKQQSEPVFLTDHRHRQAQCWKIETNSYLLAEQEIVSTNILDKWLSTEERSHINQKEVQDIKDLFKNGIEAVQMGSEEFNTAMVYGIVNEGCI